jgi:hypothetical protein
VSSKRAVLAAALALAAASMTSHVAFGRGMSGGAHFGGGGFVGHTPAISHSFVRPFRRNFAFRNGFAFRRTFVAGGLLPYYDLGGLWPDYDYLATDASDDADTTTYPETTGFMPPPMPAPVCHRSEEMVSVPSEGRGTRQIKIVRCP